MNDNAFNLGCLSIVAAILFSVVYFPIRYIESDQSDWAFQYDWFSDCPLRAERVGDHPPKGTEVWCQEKTDGGSYRRHGKTRIWYDDGQLRAEGTFVHGVTSGHWRYWTRTGRLLAEGSYASGHRQEFAWHLDHSAVARCSSQKELLLIEVWGKPRAAQDFENEPETWWTAKQLCASRNPLETQEAWEDPSAQRRSALRRPTSTDRPADGIHRTTEGETLWDIARMYQVSMADLMRANGLRSEDIRRVGPGTEIKIPVSGATSTPAPPN